MVVTDIIPFSLLSSGIVLSLYIMTLCWSKGLFFGSQRVNLRKLGTHTLWRYLNHFNLVSTLLTSKHSGISVGINIVQKLLTHKAHSGDLDAAKNPLRSSSTWASKAILFRAFEAYVWEWFANKSAVQQPDKAGSGTLVHGCWLVPTVLHPPSMSWRSTVKHARRLNLPHRRWGEGCWSGGCPCIVRIGIFCSKDDPRISALWCRRYFRSVLRVTNECVNEWRHVLFLFMLRPCLV